MSVSMNSYISAYQNSAQAVSKAENLTKKETEKNEESNNTVNVASESGVSLEISSKGLSALKNQSNEVSQQLGDGTQKIGYANGNAASKYVEDITAMSDEERSALVEQLKADQENFQNGFISMVRDMFSEQLKEYGDSGNIWKFLASGDYTVDAETKAEAQKNIAEDGYYGVKQTSERMFQFALALSGGDLDTMQEMQDAMQKGYDMAEETWGGELPEISKQTLSAANELFEEYYKSLETTT